MFCSRKTRWSSSGQEAGAPPVRAAGCDAVAAFRVTFFMLVFSFA
jgi:hypothetical protein